MWEQTALNSFRGAAQDSQAARDLVGVLMASFFVPKVLSDEVKRKQYDAYGTASFDPGATGAGAGAGRQYWSSGPSIDPEELFRKIFGEFSGSPFGDFQNVFDQPQEVRRCARFLGVGSCRAGAGQRAARSLLE